MTPQKFISLQQASRLVGLPKTILQQEIRAGRLNSKSLSGSIYTTERWLADWQAPEAIEQKERKTMPKLTKMDDLMKELNAYANKDKKAV